MILLPLILLMGAVLCLLAAGGMCLIYVVGSALDRRRDRRAAERWLRTHRAAS